MQDINRMLDKYQLEQLVAFADEGTLSSAAEQLHISQPALSKSMKKIEGDLGVELFIRDKNRLRLNATGEYAVEKARKVLEEGNDMVRQIMDYDRRLRTIAVGSCAPMPMWMLVPKLNITHSGSRVTSEVCMTEDVENGLRSGIYDIGILPYPAEIEGYRTEYWGRECLAFNLPVNHPLAKRKSLQFCDLDGEKLLVYSDVGIWDEIHKKNMPHSEFLFLENRETIAAISSMSEIPTFCTDLSIRNNPLPEGRKAVPIADEAAKVDFYVLRKK